MGMPQAAREDALKPVMDLGTPVLLAANRQFHRLLIAGVPVGSTSVTAKPVATLCAWSTGPRRRATSGWPSTSSPSPAQIDSTYGLTYAAPTRSAT